MNSKLTLPWNRDSFTADIISLMACKHSRLPLRAFPAFALSPQQWRGVEWSGEERRGCSRLHAVRKGRNRQALKGVLRVSRTTPENTAEVKGGGESEFWGISGDGGVGLFVHHQPLPVWLSLIYRVRQGSTTRPFTCCYQVKEIFQAI